MDTVTFEDALEILHLPADYTLNQLEMKYSELIRIYHPDNNPNNKVFFDILKESYELLKQLGSNYTPNITEIRNNLQDFPETNYTNEAFSNEAFNLNRSQFQSTSLYDVPDTYNIKDGTDIRGSWTPETVPDIIDGEVDNETFNKIFEYNKSKYGVMSNNGIVANSGLFSKKSRGNYSKIIQEGDTCLYDVNNVNKTYNENLNTPNYVKPSRDELNKIKLPDIKKPAQKETIEAFEKRRRERDEILIPNNISVDEFEKQKQVQERKSRFKTLMKLKHLGFLNDE